MCNIDIFKTQGILSGTYHKIQQNCFHPIKCNLYTILRPKSDFLWKLYEEQQTKHSAAMWQKTLDVCNTHTNLLMTYVTNDHENTYENAIWNSFYILRTKDISSIPKRMLHYQCLIFHTIPQF